jgi:hypothetical protein
MLQALDDPRQRTADQQVGQYGKNHRDDESLYGVDPVLHDDLVNDIDHSRRDEDLANILPRLSKDRSSVDRIDQGAQEKEGGVSFPSVTHSSTNGEEHSCSGVEGRNGPRPERSFARSCVRRVSVSIVHPP